MHQLGIVLANPVVLTALVGIITSGVVQLVKKLTGLQPNTWVTRTVIAVIAILSTVVLQSTGHSIQDPSLWTGIVQAGLLYVSAFLTHQSVLNSPPASAT